MQSTCAHGKIRRTGKNQINKNSLRRAMAKDVNSNIKIMSKARSFNLPGCFGQLHGMIRRTEEKMKLRRAMTNDVNAKIKVIFIVSICGVLLISVFGNIKLKMVVTTSLKHSTIDDISVSHIYSGTQQGSCICNGSQSFSNDDVEDIVCMKPPSVNISFKNPCWHSEKIFRCMPYFQLLGVDKSGTTDLFKRICKHPQVLGNNGVLGKETMWWPMGRYGFGYSNAFKPHRFDRYLRYFDKSAGAIFGSKDGKEMIIGEGSPRDFGDFAGWDRIIQNDGLEEPVCTTPHLIRHMNPNAKFILIFREPSDRLYSHFLFANRGNSYAKTAEGFHDAVVMVIRELNWCTSVHSLRSCLFNRTLNNITPSQMVARSFYSVFLEEWFRVFPRQQFFILKSEDYKMNMTSCMSQIFTFLGLHPLSDVEMETIVSLPMMHITKGKERAGPMLNKTRILLKTLFMNSTIRLSQMLKDERFLWHY